MRVPPARALLTCLLLLPPGMVRGAGQDRTPRPVVLSAEETEKLERETAQLCGIQPNSPESRLPWFYSYTLAERLLERGDAAKALSQLNRALHRKPRPTRGERVYGLWFVDYLPYSLLARIHDSLGEPDCARHARDVARVLEPAPRQH